MNIDHRRPAIDRPQGPFTHWNISNDLNSATRHPIPFMFGSRVGLLKHGPVDDSPHDDSVEGLILGANHHFQCTT